MTIPENRAIAPITLRPDQEEAVRALLDHFERHSRGQVDAACGTGKTLVAIRYIESVSPPAQLVAVSVPTLLLIRQWIGDWRRYQGRDYRPEFIAICSDDGVAGDVGSAALQTDGIPVTTDPRELAKLLMEQSAPGSMRICFCTPNSSEVLAEAFAIARKESRAKLRFDIVVNDEAHKTAGSVSVGGEEEDARRRLKKPGMFQAFLTDRIPASRRLNLTATPRVIAPKGRTGRPHPAALSFGVEDGDLFSMDDVSVYGRVVYRMTLPQAISRGIVAPYRVIPHFVRKSDLDFATDPANGLPYSGADREIAAAAYALQDLARHHGDLDLTHVITYHNRRTRALEMKNVLTRVSQDDCPLQCGYVDGNMPVEKRAPVLDEFREPAPGGLHVLSNCRALVEGLNVHAANAVCFADSRESPIEVMQAIGRVLRKPRDGSEKVATVIIPVVVDDTDLLDVTLDDYYRHARLDAASELKLRKVLFAMKQIDSMVADRITPLGVSARPLPDRRFPSRVHEIMHDEVDMDCARALQAKIEEAVDDLRGVSGRDYYGVEWDEDTAAWLARVDNPWYMKPDAPQHQRFGSRVKIVLGTFADAESAAFVVDEFIREHRLDWATNFGYNEHCPEPVRNVHNKLSRYPGKVSFSPKRHAACCWVAQLEIQTCDANGAPRTVIATRTRGSEEDAVRAYDALCARYGCSSMMIFPGDRPRYELILRRRGAACTLPEGVEEDSYYRHDPAKRYWAYDLLDSGEAIGLGYYPDEASAAAAVRSAQAERGVSKEASPRTARRGGGAAIAG